MSASASQSGCGNCMKTAQNPIADFEPCVYASPVAALFGHAAAVLLFSDAKARKDVFQNVVGTHFAGYFA